jgi:hypothetical protein
MELKHLIVDLCPGLCDCSREDIAGPDGVCELCLQEAKEWPDGTLGEMDERMPEDQYLAVS